MCISLAITMQSANNIKYCILTAADLPQFIKNKCFEYFVPTHESSEGNYDHHQAVKKN
jgi:hypothetical protein